MIDPTNITETHGGIEYSIAGGYVDESRKRGNFMWRCCYGFGIAGDLETARKKVVEIIDRNLASPRRGGEGP